MTKEITVQQDVEKYQNQVTFVESAASSLEIKTEADMSKGSDLLNDLKAVETMIVERKQAITRPLMTALASARDLFKPLETGYASAKKTIKDKMLDYTVVEEERIEKQKGFVEGRMERGTIRTDTAIKKMEDIGEVKTSYDGDKAKTSIRKVTKVRIISEELIPREYLIPDMKKITEAVLRQKQIISGVETYEEKSIVGRSR